MLSVLNQIDIDKYKILQFYDWVTEFFLPTIPSVFFQSDSIKFPAQLGLLTQQNAATLNKISHTQQTSSYVDILETFGKKCRSS